MRGGCSGSAFDQGFDCGAGFFVYFFGLGVGLEAVDRLLVGAAGAEEEAGGEEVGGERARHGHLLFDRRHFGPAVEDVSHVVGMEDVEIFRPEQLGVAHLNAVLPIGRELPEEGIERGNEVAQALEVRRIKDGEFEDEHAGFPVMRRERAEEGVDEKFGLEEVFVLRPGAVAEAVELGKFFHRDFVGHFVAQPEVVGNLRAKAREEFIRGKAVVAGIDADGWKGVGVFLEALGLEAAGGNFAAREVALRVVDLPEPALVFPRRGAEVQVVFPREARCLAGERRGEREGSRGLKVEG